MKNFISLDVPFRPFSDSQVQMITRVETSYKYESAHLHRRFYAGCLGRVLLNITDLNNSIPNGSLIVAKGKRRKNTNVSLRNVKK